MGYALRRSRLLVGSWQLGRGISGNFAWNRRQLCCGIRGSFYAESVATFGWNRWQLSDGIGGNFRVEYAGALLRAKVSKSSEPLRLFLTCMFDSVLQGHTAGA